MEKSSGQEINVVISDMSLYPKFTVMHIMLQGTGLGSPLKSLKNVFGMTNV